MEGCVDHTDGRGDQVTGRTDAADMYHFHCIGRRRRRRCRPVCHCSTFGKVQNSITTYNFCNNKHAL